jgi:hypothetical protein
MRFCSRIRFLIKIKKQKRILVHILYSKKVNKRDWIPWFNRIREFRFFHSNNLIFHAFFTIIITMYMCMRCIYTYQYSTRICMRVILKDIVYLELIGSGDLNSSITFPLCSILFSLSQEWCIYIFNVAF